MTRAASGHRTDESRRGVWEWAQVVLVLGNLVWTTLCLGGFRPETRLVSLTLTGVLLAVHAMERAVRRDETGSHPAGWWLLPFLVYAAANVVWVSPVPWIGWRDWLGWAQMIAVFWVVLNGVRSRAARGTLFWGLAVLGFVAVVLACYQRFVAPQWLMMGRVQAEQFIGRASGPFGIPNSLAALLLLLLPALAAMALRRGASAASRVLCGYLALAFAFGIFLTVSRGGWLALAIVLAAWPVCVARGSWLRRGALAMATAAGLLAVVVILFLTVPLVRERLTSLKTDVGERTRPIMWRGAWRIFEDQPVWGSGGGSYNALFEKHRPERYQDEPVWAHNDYLNTLSDYGLVGWTLFFGACGVVVWRCVRGTRANRARGREAESLARAGASDVQSEPPYPPAALVAGLAAFALQLFLDFHFKIPALAMAFAMVAALVVQATWTGSMRRRLLSAGVNRSLPAVFALGVLGGSAWVVWPFYHAEALRYGARQAIDRLAVRQMPVEAWAPVLSDVREALRRAVELSPGNGAAWADFSYATTLQVRSDPTQAKSLGREAEAYANRALACSKVIPEFWVRRGVALDLQGRRVEGGGAFIEALRLAPASAAIWYYQAFHLSLDPSEPGRALAAAAFCLRLDPGNHEAQALRQRLAERSRAP